MRSVALKELGIRLAIDDFASYLESQPAVDPRQPASARLGARLAPLQGERNSQAPNRAIQAGGRVCGSEQTQSRVSSRWCSS